MTSLPYNTPNLRVSESAPFEMSVKNALKLFGISEGASF